MPDTTANVLDFKPYKARRGEEFMNDRQVEHFRNIAREGLPIVIYNIPGRCSIGLDISTYRERNFVFRNLGGGGGAVMVPSGYWPVEANPRAQRPWPMRRTARSAVRRVANEIKGTNNSLFTSK